MKNLIIYILLFNFLSILGELSAQNSKETPLRLLGTYNPDKESICLRWLPDMKTYELGKIHGYELIKLIFDENGGYERVVLFSGKIPLDSLNEDGNISIAINQLLVSEFQDSSDNNQDSTYIPLGKAVRLQEFNEDKYLMLMMMLDLKFDASYDLSLGYEDPDIQTGDTITYVVKLGQSDSDDDQEEGEVDEGEVEIDPNVDPVAPPNSETDSLVAKIFASYTIIVPETTNSRKEVTGLKGNGGNKVANLTWNNADIENDYTYFDIYRSDEVDTTFTKVNEQPYQYFFEKDSDHDVIEFHDKLPENNKLYIYKIKGISPFDFQSNFTDTIHVVGIPPRLNFELKIDTIYCDVNSGITLNWASLPPAYNDSLTRFDVYFKESVQDTAVKSNSSPLSSSIRTYTITNAPSSAYVYLEAHDPSGHIYQSINNFVQAIDSVPPAIPTGLTGYISKDGKVSMTWDENTESDLDGYLVYFSNGSEGTFTTITPRVIKDANLETQIDVEFNIDSIYYKVLAVDKRFNRSEMSEVMPLRRPDIFGPSKPIITQLLPRPEGIRIAWRLGSDEGVKYKLQRKRVNSVTWVTLLQFDKNDTFSIQSIPEDIDHPNYLDDGDLVLAPYHFRILAEGQNGMQSSSNLYTISPYDDGIRGTISQLMANLVTQMLIWNPNAGTIGGNNQPSGAVEKKDGKAARLSWQYSTTYSNSLQSFKIYRKTPPAMSSNNGSDDFVLIKTIPAAEALHNAEIQGLNGGYAYYDTVLGKSTSGQIKYKVISYHNDGGQSNWTNEVILVLSH